MTDKPSMGINEDQRACHSRPSPKAAPTAGAVTGPGVPFTPGPWEIGESDTFGVRVQQVEARLHPQSGHLGARMYVHRQIAICKEVTAGAAAANARLIAAAPELLEALADTRETLSGDVVEYDTIRDLLQRIDAALSRARPS